MGNLWRVLLRLCNSFAFRVTGFEYFMVRCMMLNTTPSEARIQLLVKQNSREFEDTVKLMIGGIFGLSNADMHIDVRIMHTSLQRWRRKYSRAVTKVQYILEKRWFKLKMMTSKKHTKGVMAIRNSFLLHNISTNHITRHIYLSGGLIDYA